jgi:hypothetical protein
VTTSNPLVPGANQGMTVSAPDVVATTSAGTSVALDVQEIPLLIPSVTVMTTRRSLAALDAQLLSLSPGSLGVITSIQQSVGLDALPLSLQSMDPATSIQLQPVASLMSANLISSPFTVTVTTSIQHLVLLDALWMNLMSDGVLGKLDSSLAPTLASLSTAIMAPAINVRTQRRIGRWPYMAPRQYIYVVDAEGNILTDADGNYVIAGVEVVRVMSGRSSFFGRKGGLFSKRQFLISAGTPLVIGRSSIFNSYPDLPNDELFVTTSGDSPDPEDGEHLVPPSG